MCLIIILLMMDSYVLFTTIHPAPYMDIIIRSLKNEHNVQVLYKCEIDKYKRWKLYKGENGLFFSNMSFISLFRKVRNSKFVILGGWNSIMSLEIILLSILLHKKIAVFSDCPRSIRSKYSFFIKKYILFNLIDYLFCATHATADFYSKYYNFNRKNMRFFPYGITFPSESNLCHINKFNEGGHIKIFIANNFYKRKGYSVVLKAFEILNNQNMLEKFDITIAGVGEESLFYRNKLSKLSRSIHFLDWLEPDEYYKYLDQTDIYIHASLFEPFGIPPLEAMARGKIVIVSDAVQSTCRLIKNGENGYLYSSYSPNELAEILRNISLGNISNYVLKAREDVVAMYDCDYGKIVSDCIN